MEFYDIFYSNFSISNLNLKISKKKIWSVEWYSFVPGFYYFKNLNNKD